MMSKMSNKSELITYVLWMTLGWFGIHHLYLRRYRHGFVWLWTLGGCCGLGWLLESCRLSSYIDSANNTAGHRRNAAVSFSWKRFTGQLVFSMLLGVLSVSSIPKHILTMYPILSSVAAIFIAAGVHTVANVDPSIKCSYMTCLLGACIPLPMLLFTTKLDTFITYSCLSSVIIANMYGTHGRHRPKSDDPCRAWLYLSVANLLMVVMFTSALYYNCSVTTRDGVEIPLRDAFRNILVSPAWAELGRTVPRLLHRLINEGFHKFMFDLRVVLDPEGENSAYRLLGFTGDESWSVTEQQLTERYRQLVRQYHPDKVHSLTDTDRRQAELHFIAIQQAYEKLSVIKRRRTDRTEL